MMKTVLRVPVQLYRLFISPLLGPRCRFEPTCSSYALEALEKHGAVKGLFLSLRRLSRCHPWRECNRHDPVPESFEWRIDWPVSMGYKRGNANKATAPAKD